MSGLSLFIFGALGEMIASIREKMDFQILSGTFEKKIHADLPSEKVYDSKVKKFTMEKPEKQVTPLTPEKDYPQKRDKKDRQDKYPRPEKAEYPQKQDGSKKYSSDNPKDFNKRYEKKERTANSDIAIPATSFKDQSEKLTEDQDINNKLSNDVKATTISNPQETVNLIDDKRTSKKDVVLETEPMVDSSVFDDNISQTEAKHDHPKTIISDEIVVNHSF
jgi:hypothetical protein